MSRFALAILARYVHRAPGSPRALGAGNPIRGALLPAQSPRLSPVKSFPAQWSIRAWPSKVGFPPEPTLGAGSKCQI
jgi:hypothetical protein